MLNNNAEYKWEKPLNIKPLYDVEVLCKVKGFGLLYLKLKKIGESKREDVCSSAFFRLPLETEDLWYCEDSEEYFKYNMVSFWTYVRDRSLESTMDNTMESTMDYN